jgi:hypothetical protein
VSLTEGAALLFAVGYISLCFHEEIMYESFYDWATSSGGLFLLSPFLIIGLVLILIAYMATYFWQTVRPRMLLALRVIPSVWAFALVAVGGIALFFLAYHTTVEFFQDLLIKLSSAICLSLALISFHEKKLAADTSILLLEAGATTVFVAAFIERRFVQAVLVELGCGVAFFVVIEHLLQLGLQKARKQLLARLASVTAELEALGRVEAARRAREEEEGWTSLFSGSWFFGDQPEFPTVGFGVPDLSVFGGITVPEDDDGWPPMRFM